MDTWHAGGSFVRQGPPENPPPYPWMRAVAVCVPGPEEGLSLARGGLGGWLRAAEGMMVTEHRRLTGGSLVAVPALLAAATPDG